MTGFFRIVKAVKDVDVYIEQPCATFEECLTVRRKTELPFVMDENIDDIYAILKLWKEGAGDVVNVKISKFGGLTKAKQVDKMCISDGADLTHLPVKPTLRNCNPGPLMW